VSERGKAVKKPCLLVAQQLAQDLRGWFRAKREKLFCFALFGFFLPSKRFLQRAFDVVQCLAKKLGGEPRDFEGLVTAC